jgi:HlyD family secretion protein
MTTALVPDQEAPVGPVRARRRWALIVAVGCAVVSTGGLIVSSFVKSPAQQLAEAGPPKPSVLTAPVERRVLSATTITRGTVAAGRTLEVTPVTAGAAAQIVTAVRVKAGGTVQPGGVMVAVSGRPLIALRGAVPAYRDLKPGDHGDDVRQLQAALADLGHSRGGDPKGTFGAGTKAAVRALYADLGYDAPDTAGLDKGGDQSTALAAADDAVRAAEDAVDVMRRRIAAGEKATVAEKPLAQQLTDLKTTLSRSRDARSRLIATTGTMMPLSEFVFVPTFPARVAELTARVGDVVKAPLLKISTGELLVRVQAEPDVAEGLRAGMPAELDAEALGGSAKATVTSVGQVTTPAGEGQQSPYRPVVLTPVKKLPEQWAGQEVRVTITAARTESPVLVVPVSAVSAGADGRSTVSVVGDNDTTRRVEVEVGLAGDGYLEVRPIGGEVSEGDRVAVGAMS